MENLLGGSSRSDGARRLVDQEVEVAAGGHLAAGVPLEKEEVH